MKCPNCQKKIARYPIKDEQGNIIWINLFKMDLFSIIFLIAITLMIYGYKADIEMCHNVTVDPCDYCMKSGCFEQITYKESKEPEWEIIEQGG